MDEERLDLGDEDGGQRNEVEERKEAVLHVLLRAAELEVLGAAAEERVSLRRSSRRESEGAGTHREADRERQRAVIKPASPRIVDRAVEGEEGALRDSLELVGEARSVCEGSRGQLERIGEPERGRWTHT